MAKRKPTKKKVVRKKVVRKKVVKKKPTGYQSQLVFRDPDVSNEDLWRKIFWGASAVALVVTVLLSLGSGMNGDDFFQNDYSDKLITFYTSLGQDTSAFDNPRAPIEFYGGAYELPAKVLNEAFGYESNDEGYHDVRHILNAIFGFIAMLFTGLLAKQIGGWRAGVLALTIIFLSPRFLGHSLMNPKDIPFAAGYAMALYFMTGFLRQLPKPKTSTLLGLAGGIGIAFGTRAGGLLLVAYLGLFTAVAYVLQYGWSAILGKSKQTLQYIAYAAAAAFVGLLMGLLLWPYGLVDPFNHVPEALGGLTQFAVNIRMLFAGDMIYGKSLPISYLPTWLVLTIPLSTIFGFLLMLGFSKGIFKKYTPIFLALVLFTFFFPIIYITIQNSTLYDGWRHTTFTYIPLVALAAIGWLYVLDRFSKQKAIAYTATALLVLTVAEPASFIARNPHFPYVYFNPIAGGIKGAYGEFETDYWGVSVKQGIDWMEKQGILDENMRDTITVMSDFSYPLEKYLRKQYDGHVKTNYIRFRQRYNEEWDYALFTSRFVQGSRFDAGTWPPDDKVIHTIDANGVPLLAIMKAENDNAFKGVQAAKAQNWRTAIQYLEQEVQDYPGNEIAWTELGRSYLQLQQHDKAEQALNNALEIEPEDLQATNLLGLLYLRTQRTQEGVALFRKSLEFEPKNSLAYYYIATVDRQRNDLNAALENAKKSIEVNSRFKAGYQLVAEIYQQMGDAASAQKYMEAMSRVQ